MRASAIEHSMNSFSHERIPCLECVNALTLGCLEVELAVTLANE